MHPKVAAEADKGSQMCPSAPLPPALMYAHSVTRSLAKVVNAKITHQLQPRLLVGHGGRGGGGGLVIGRKLSSYPNKCL